jgi:malate dehydrogenase (oxaloacetate-decarboxylating)
MHHKHKKDPQGQAYYEVNQSDFDLVRNPILNKGSAFPQNERHEFGLHGILPVTISDLATQKQRSYKAFQSKATPLEKYIYLREVQDSNETLFYSLIVDHTAEMMPIVYTPVVGEACQNFSHIYRRPRGLYLTPGCIDTLDEIFKHIRFDEIEAIVVSDGERILGLGDQGAGGMGIPIGKLSLYTACAGIHPASTLPILLDTGTNNPDLINDPLYMGWRHPRIRGQEYDDFIELFVQAIKKRFPHVLLQWEDFAQQNANPILARYRNKLCTFNDDIQGTAAIATGTLLAAVQAAHASIKDQRVVVVGGGSAGCGISSLMAQAMIDAGLSAEEAHARFYLIDAHGLLTDETPNLQSFQQPFTQKKTNLQDWTVREANTISFFDVVKNAKPTVMLGVSGQPGLFTEEIIRLMAAQVQRPIIFPLSNPTSRSEGNPADIMKWTEGRAIVGTGSPFPDILHNGKPRRVDQTNNAYIFPGMGLGIIAVKAKHVTDLMFMAAAKALADLSPAKNNPDANLLPPLDQIRAVSRRVAIDVAMEAVKASLTPHPMTEAEVIAAIDAKMWYPDYIPYVKK